MSSRVDLKLGEQPTDRVGVFGLLLHKAHERTPLVDGESSVFDLVVQDVEAFAGARHGAFYTTKVPARPVDAALREDSSADGEPNGR